MLRMKLAIVGFGVQGRKRKAVAGSDAVAIVDPVSVEAGFRRIEELPLESYNAACVCVPDDQKLPVLRYLLAHGKHVMVEKPLPGTRAELEELASLAKSKSVAAYTAYNHRFEPHIATAGRLIQEGRLGTIYLARFLYGNGTARDVRNSAWRDQGAGVLTDLGSHLLDMAHFLFGERRSSPQLWSVNRFENRAPDHALFGFTDRPVLEMEVTLLSWRNSFRLELYGEKGSLHIDSLCKWGPSTLTVRERVLPSGRPRESIETVEQPDPTWKIEDAYFRQLCAKRGSNWENDLWIGEKLEELKRQAS